MGLTESEFSFRASELILTANDFDAGSNYTNESELSRLR